MKIIAVDFDGVLCEDKFPDIGDPDIEMIDKLREAQKVGIKLILWTCREDIYQQCELNDDVDWPMLVEAVRWCENLGLRFNAVNENVGGGEWEKWAIVGGLRRKVFADLYLDDRGSGWNREQALVDIQRLIDETKRNEEKGD